MTLSTLPPGPGTITGSDIDSGGAYDRIYRAILEHRLQPGVKLPEERLATIFDASRAKVRKVLVRLEHEGLVETIHNRGAHVAQPTVDRATQTIEARQVIEPAILRLLADRASEADVGRLRAHVASEYVAADANDRPTTVRLAVEYHNLVADLAGNVVLARMLRELTALTCLTILLYNAPTATSCLPDDHVELTDAIADGDADRAAALVIRHLDAVQSSLVFEHVEPEADLESILG